MENRYKILIHCPIGIFNNDSYMSILNIDTSKFNVDLLFTVYNEFNPMYENGIERNPKWGQNVANKMNKARKIVLDNNYDFMFNIEHDIIVKSDIINNIMKYASDYECLTGLYRCRKTRNMNAPLCLKTINKEWPTYASIKDKEKVRLWIIPFGCILIPRMVLENVTFDPGIDGHFAGITDKLGIKKYAIPSIICDHMDRDGVVYKVAN